MRRTLLKVLALGLPGLQSAMAQTAAQTAGAYDEAADARADVERAVTDAAQSGMSVLLVFGANWCGDCKVLDLALKSGAASTLVQQRFRVVKVNVGRFDRNVDLAERYGVPLKRGIPAIAVLSGQGVPWYATTAGELADARKMGDTAIHDFLARVAAHLPR